jgi:hypothetical protein
MDGSSSTKSTTGESDAVVFIPLSLSMTLPLRTKFRHVGRKSGNHDA